MSAAAVGQAAPTLGSHWAVGVMSELGGKYYEATATFDDLERTPTWNPALNPLPPLSPGEALRRALEAMKSQFPSAANWPVHGIALNWSVGPNHWYYVVEFVPSGAANQTDGIQSTVRMLVLMNGKPIPPKPFRGSESEQPTVRKNGAS